MSLTCECWGGPLDGAALTRTGPDLTLEVWTSMSGISTRAPALDYTPTPKPVGRFLGLYRLDLTTHRWTWEPDA